MTLTKKGSGTASKAEYGSDVIVDMLRALEIDYVAMNPGATFRGLHDSLVNYGENTAPEMLLCTHEETAVAIADGYAKTAGKPMAAIVHDIVGLLHSSMAVFNAWEGQSPVLVLGATGPMAVEARRPGIDWVHTALVQGQAIRDYVKWDDQPASIPSLIDSLLRAKQLATTEPQGPVYVCFDAGLQEGRLDGPVTLPDVSKFRTPSRVQADPQVLEQAAELLLRAERPVIINGVLGTPEASAGLVRLAEALALPVIDAGFSFPSRHPLNQSDYGRDLLSQADVVLALDIGDLHAVLTTVDRITRLATDIIPDTTKTIDMTMRHYAVKSWVTSYGKIRPVDLRVSADTALAMPALADLCLAKLAAGPDRSAELSARTQRFGAKQEEAHRQAVEAARAASSERPIAPSFLSQQLSEVVAGHDWVLTGGMRAWVREIWDIRERYQYVAGGSGGGVGNGFARALGAALANKGTGRLSVNFQADGDMLFTPSALWTAAHHRIPMLAVMHNNRSYYNDQEHQANIAIARGRNPENQWVGIRVEDPEVDFGAMARSFGVYGEGPIDDPAALRPALERALRVVVEEGRCALVDVVTQNR